MNARRGGGPTAERLLARLRPFAPLPTLRPPRGMVEADGLVLDVARLGPEVALGRALVGWVAGTRLLVLPGGGWLLLWPQPRRVRSDGHGLPVRLEGGDVVVPVHGRQVRFAVAALVAVDATAVLALPADLPVAVLEPLEAPLPAPDVEPLPLQLVADVLGRAGIDRTPAERVRARLRRDAERAAGGGAGAGRGTGGGAAGGTGGRPRWRGLIRGRSRGQGTGQTTSRGGATAALARLLGRAPVASHLLQRRQAAYVRQLLKRFDTGRLDEALRHAIALGDGETMAALSMPGPRQGPLTPGLGAGGVAVGVGVANLQGMLAPRYREAAKRLERAGRIDEAAFVLADLLDAPADAVALYERVGRWREAAELAEARRLRAAEQVRLWWLAGDRVRAVRAGVLGGAFSEAVERLNRVDAEAAAALRAMWVDSDRERGDLASAVRHAWPDHELRKACLPDLGALLAAGGPDAGEWLARLLALSTAPQAGETALAVLAAPSDAAGPAAGAGAAQAQQRAGLVAALADHVAADAVADRRVATAALRALASDPDVVAVIGASGARRVWGALTRRADPLAAADLRLPADPSPPPSPRTLVAAGPGGAEVMDAALVAGGILVALGAAGVRLLTRDGRTRARWSAPAYRLVVADSGRVALLVVRGGQGDVVRRLDVAGGGLGRELALEGAVVCGSFDGRLLLTARDGALEFVDVTGPRPAIAWRELGDVERLLAVGREQGGLHALVLLEGAPRRLELREWSLGDLLTRARIPLQWTPGERQGQWTSSPAVGRGWLASLEVDPGGSPVLNLRKAGTGRTLPAPEGSRLHQVGLEPWLSAQLEGGVHWWPVAQSGLHPEGLGSAQGQWPASVAVLPGAEHPASIQVTPLGTVIADQGGRVLAFGPDRRPLASFVVAE